MGTNQLLLIVLGVFIVGAAIAVSLNLFDTQFSKQMEDMAVKEMHQISSFALTHWKNPKNTGGGSGSYNGFVIPKAIADGESNWNFELRISDNELIFFMISKKLAHNGQPYILQGIHKNGKLVLIKLFDPEMNIWKTLVDNSKKEVFSEVKFSTKDKDDSDNDEKIKKKRKTIE